MTERFQVKLFSGMRFACSDQQKDNFYENNEPLFPSGQYGRFSAKAGVNFSNWFEAAKDVKLVGWDDVDDETTTYHLDDHDISLTSFFLRLGLEFQGRPAGVRQATSHPGPAG